MENNYTVSARKFRPQTFSEIIGQPHIVRTLTNSLSNGRIAHAYIFSGTRGVGKTTTARILAKALNCKNGPTPSPCLVCDNCKEIAQGSSIDVMEIDGASNRGIDNIRELRDNAKFTPTNSKYKIYIIDEVHQITKDAFNALLKTLEEPPAHVIFIFATTELNKVLDTILSRCQCFEYRPISMQDIIGQLNFIADKENIEITSGAVELLARRGRGSMRDSQSLFDQAAAYGGGKVGEEDVKLILGMVDQSLIYNVLDAIIALDKAKVLELAQLAAYSGNNPLLFVEDLSKTIRDIMMAKVSPDRLVDLEQDEKEKLGSWAQALDYDEIQRFFLSLTVTLEQMKRSPQPEINLEMGLLRLTEKRDSLKIDDLLSKVSKAQTALEERGVIPAQYVANHAQTSNARAPESSIEVDSNLEPAPSEISEAISAEPSVDLITAFKKGRPSFMGLFEHCEAIVSGDAVVIEVDNLFHREQLEEPDNKRKLEQIASDNLGKSMRIVIKYTPKKKVNSAPDKKKVIKIIDAKRYIEETPIIQKAMDIFNGEVTGVNTIDET